MAKSTDTTYYQDATATCSNCGSTYTLGLTTEKLQLEICGNCHPFYTGQQVFLDTTGRIEKFNARASQIQAPTVKKKQKKARKNRQSLSDLAPDADEDAGMTVEVKGAATISQEEK